MSTSDLNGNWKASKVEGLEDVMKALGMESMYSKFDINKEELSIDRKGDEVTLVSTTMFKGYQADERKFTSGESKETSSGRTTTMTLEGNTIKWDISGAPSGNVTAQHTLSDDGNTLTSTVTFSIGFYTIVFTRQ